MNLRFPNPPAVSGPFTTQKWPHCLCVLVFFHSGQVQQISASWVQRNVRHFQKDLARTVSVALWNCDFTEMSTCHCESQISFCGALLHLFRQFYGLTISWCWYPGSLPSSSRVVPDSHGLWPRGGGKGQKPRSTLSASLLLLGIGSSEGLLQVPWKIKDLHS